MCRCVWLCLAVSRTLLSRFPEALVVPDLCKDVRFKDSAVVNGWPHLRFYAAAPLVNATNSRLGTL
jgi:GAF domain-containing protein